MKKLVQENKNIIRLWIAWISVVVIMIVIYSLSSQVSDTSNQLSTGVTEKVVKAVETVVPKVDLNVKDLNHIVRKNAHFFIYCTLGFLLMNAMKRSEITRYYGILLALSIGTVYAITDEFHQSMIPGRGPQLTDVLIDGSGVLFGVLLYILIFKWKRRE